MIATAFTAAVPDPGRFGSGRHLSAWLGLVPAQHSTGGRPRPLGLSKRGDAYLRRQLIPSGSGGARAVVRVSRHRRGRLWAWTLALLARRPFNVVVAPVAQAAQSPVARPRPANKLARIIWALLSRGEAYRAA